MWAASSIGRAADSYTAGCWFDSSAAHQPSLTLANERVSFGWQAMRRLSAVAAQRRRRTPFGLANMLDSSAAHHSFLAAALRDSPSGVVHATGSNTPRGVGMS